MAETSFKQRYDSIKVIADAIALGESLSQKERKKIFGVLKNAKKYFGLDMREDWFMGILETQIAHHKVIDGGAD